LIYGDVEGVYFPDAEEELASSGKVVGVGGDQGWDGVGASLVDDVDEAFVFKF